MPGRPLPTTPDVLIIGGGAARGFPAVMTGGRTRRIIHSGRVKAFPDIIWLRPMPGGLQRRASCRTARADAVRFELHLQPIASVLLQRHDLAFPAQLRVRPTVWRLCTEPAQLEIAIANQVGRGLRQRHANVIRPARHQAQRHVGPAAARAERRRLAIPRRQSSKLEAPRGIGQRGPVRSEHDDASRHAFQQRRGFRRHHAARRRRLAGAHGCEMSQRVQEIGRHAARLQRALPSRRVRCVLGAQRLQSAFEAGPAGFFHLWADVVEVRRDLGKQEAVMGAGDPSKPSVDGARPATKLSRMAAIGTRACPARTEAMREATRHPSRGV